MEINPNLSDKALQDYKLVLAAIEGDQRAFAELMGRYRDAIYYMLLKMVNNKSDADDLTIEAFGKAFKKLSQYTPNYAFSTWLFKIATNNCIDHMRKIKGHRVSIDINTEDEEGDSTMNLPSDVLDPEEKLIRKQRKILLNTVVEKLKPRYRKLIELRYFKELSYEEISIELELPLGTIKAQLFRAKELLSIILKHSSGKF
ncbi:MAG: RNA polymerase subunit sigma-24 [Bacteroidetes bacterium GWA2_31_9]|nr:MAG: RNA polymerase subunit sigma-24 [Bacteroidetes bacterium GWA2_31_9]